MGNSKRKKCIHVVNRNPQTQILPYINKSNVSMWYMGNHKLKYSHTETKKMYPCAIWEPPDSNSPTHKPERCIHVVHGNSQIKILLHIIKENVSTWYLGNPRPKKCIHVVHGNPQIKILRNINKEIESMWFMGTPKFNYSQT